ncbi:MAG: crossover junction endodeoxyribonuclease RuvC [Planctomycetota bacterium]
MLPDDLVPPDCPWPIVLGLDPGTRIVGYGAIVLAPDGPRLLACGVLRPPSRLAAAARLARIAAELEEILRAVRPALVVVERAFAARNVQSALRIGEARGVALAAAARAGAPVVELAPAAAKKALVGHGGASKEQVAAMVAARLGRGELAVPHDATDALALALAHVHRSRFAEIGRGTGAGGTNGA